MSDAPSFAEIEGQHVELLPARTVLSLFSLTNDGGGGGGGGGDSTVVMDACAAAAANGKDLAGVVACVPGAIVNNHG